MTNGCTIVSKAISGIDEPTQEQLQYWKLRQAYKADKKDSWTQIDKALFASQEVQTEGNFSNEDYQNLLNENQKIQDIAMDAIRKLEDTILGILDTPSNLDNENFVARIRYQLFHEVD